jgi:serine phosphatase RsbU (regulator of sigma subunit)
MTPEPLLNMREHTQTGEWLAFLNDATSQIGAALDLERTALGFCEATVPFFADSAVVYLLDALFTDRVIPSVPSAATAVRRMVTIPAPADWAGPSPVEPDSPFAQAMATGHPELIPAAAAADCVPPGWTGRALVVPFRVRGTMLGFAVLGRRPGRDSCDETDLLVARQLGAQAALSIHNAYLYQREAATADVLQRSMLPARPPTLPGVQIAHRYLPGSPTAQVGGDWFDAIPLPGSRVALVVGDVMGHGIHSAAAMGRLRTAVQTLASLDLPPDQVLRHLDDVAQEMGEYSLATCVYCVYDPVAQRCTIANAGHIPPVLVDPDGFAELLDIPAGGPIGVGGISFQTVEVEAPDGSLLVLCTDGLVEVRGRDIGQGLAALCRNLNAPSAPLDQQCETLLRELDIAKREDDVALLMARLCGIPADQVANWILEPHPRTPGQVRRLVRATLAGWGLADHSELAELLACEIVTNAVRYATRPIAVRLLRTDVLLCEVSDDDHRLPVLQDPSLTDESGRGLHLVAQLATRWGASRLPAGKVVWFEQSIEGSG